MIGFSVGDIVKLLEQIPIWKTLVTLPKHVRDLEARVAVLEKKPAASPDKACALCGAEMKTTAVREDPVFGVMGLKEHVLTCPTCGHSETRQVDPKKN